MRPAPDTVHIVEKDLLTEGYRIENPLFHKLFHHSVENFAEINGVGMKINWSVSLIECSRARGSNPEQCVL
jgi:hypothetical protein